MNDISMDLSTLVDELAALCANYTNIKLNGNHLDIQNCFNLIGKKKQQIMEYHHSAIEMLELKVRNHQHLHARFKEVIAKYYLNLDKLYSWFYQKQEDIPLALIEFLNNHLKLLVENFEKDIKSLEIA